MTILKTGECTAIFENIYSAAARSDAGALGLRQKRVEMPSVDRQSELQQMSAQMLGGTHSEFEHGVVDVRSSDFIGVCWRVSPNIFEPQNGQTRLFGELISQLMRVHDFGPPALVEPE